MEVTPNCFGLLLKLLLKVQPKIVCALEGGYNCIELTNSVLQCIKVLLGNDHEKLEKNEMINENYIKIIENVKEIQKNYWKCFQ
jgi:acetoin utilization deacetylase AcuC-like enzyme